MGKKRPRSCSKFSGGKREERQNSQCQQPTLLTRDDFYTPSEIRVVLEKVDLEHKSSEEHVQNTKCKLSKRDLKSSGIFCFTDVNQNDTGIDLQMALKVLSEKSCEIEKEKCEMSLLKKDNESLKKRLIYFEEKLCTGVAISTSADDSLLTDDEQQHSAQSFKCSSKIVSTAPLASSSNSKEARAPLPPTELLQSATEPTEAIKHAVNSVSNVIDLISPKVLHTDKLETDANSEDDSGIEVDVKLDLNAIQSNHLSPLMASASNTTPRSLSRTLIAGPISAPPGRNPQLCKYGRLSSGNKDRMCRVSFQYPQSVPLDDSEISQLKNSFKKDEMYLFPLYNQFRLKKPFSPLTRRNAPKTCDNDMTLETCVARHEPLENGEKLRKKWADNRDRQLQQHEALKRRQKRTAYEMLGLTEPERTFQFDASQISQVEVAQTVPLSAFGHNVPYLTSKCFFLPWFRPNK